MLDRAQVVAVYNALLGRPPESERTLAVQMESPSLDGLIVNICHSIEWQERVKPGPAWNYAASFDAVQTILAHEDKARRAVAGHRVNFFGVAVNVDKFYPALKLDNVVEPPPIPANWHADIAEFGPALRAVDLSGGDFCMIELGCGWGCWMNITGAAARRAGKRPFLIGVEGDAGHVAFAHESMATNGFAPSQFQVVRGIAAAKAGSAFFPRQSLSGVAWGLEPVLNADKAQIRALRAGGEHDELPMVALKDVILDRRRIDLLHVDIQGGETALVRENVALLGEKVAYAFIATHSRMIDGEIVQCLSDAGWELEMERPCVCTIHDGRLVNVIDGAQGWRNKRFSGRA